MTKFPIEPNPESDNAVPHRPHPVYLAAHGLAEQIERASLTRLLPGVTMTRDGQPPGSPPPNLLPKTLNN